MMYSSLSLKIRNFAAAMHRNGTLRGFALCAALTALLAARVPLADTLAETIPVKNKSAVITGVVIDTSDSEPAQASGSELEIESVDGLQIREYRQGEHTIREYRSGGRLMHVEMHKAGQPAFVFDHTKQDRNPDRRPRSGIIISNW